MERPTIRDVMRRKKRLALLVLVASWLSFTPSVLIESGGQSLLAFVPVGIFAGAVIFLAFFIRCPRCKGNLVGFNANIGKIGSRAGVDCCQHCGVSLDAPAKP
jgi:hypothetical protein